MNGTILVADDSLVVRAVLRRQLEADGHHVIEATDGEEAIIACREHRPDVVLLDVEMPVLDGHATLARLKADEDLRDIPVVFLTGRVDTADVVTGLRLGAHDYLRKPFEANELMARVSAALRTKELQDELRARNAELDRVSRINSLTGLFNRRHLDEHLRREISGARRHERLVGVMILDIDHFKQVNDQYGHPNGDVVLREVAQRLLGTLRTEDALGRWGGEEFIAVLTEFARVVDLRHRRADAPCHRGEAVRPRRREFHPGDGEHWLHLRRGRRRGAGAPGRRRPLRGQGRRAQPGDGLDDHRLTDRRACHRWDARRPSSIRKVARG